MIRGVVYRLSYHRSEDEDRQAWSLSAGVHLPPSLPPSICPFIHAIGIHLAPLLLCVYPTYSPSMFLFLLDCRLRGYIARTITHFSCLISWLRSANHGFPGCLVKDQYLPRVVTSTRCQPSHRATVCFPYLPDSLKTSSPASIYSISVFQTSERSMKTKWGWGRGHENRLDVDTGREAFDPKPHP